MGIIIKLFWVIISAFSWLLAATFALLIFAPEFGAGWAIGLASFFSWLGYKLWPSRKEKLESIDEIPTYSTQVQSHSIKEQPRQREYDQRKSVKTSLATWYPPNHSVKIGSFNITGGMIYVGSDASYRQWRSTINPKLQVARSNPDLAGQEMYYWPSYADMAPRSRLAFLEWLESGRRTKIDIGYVFIFFYGLERRILHDREFADAPAILDEVKQLLAIYGSNNSFKHYAKNFIQAVKGQELAANNTHNKPPEVKAPPTHYEFPLPVLIELGKKLQETEVLDALWMFVWHAHHPETRFRVPAQRAFLLYKAMFSIRFKAKYPKGLKIKLPKKKLSFQYRAASSDFTTDLDFNIPDISTLKAPWNAANKIAEQCQEELATYSRYVGKFPHDQYLPKAVALLPLDIARQFTLPAVKQLREWVNGKLTKGYASIIAQELLDKLELSGATGKRLTKTHLKQISNIMKANGYGIEPGPDTSFARPEFTEPIVVFQLPEDETASFTEAFNFMSLSVFLGASMANADGTIDEDEKQSLRNMIINNPVLTELEKLHLEAQANWFMHAPQSTTKLKGLLQELPNAQRQDLANQAVTMSVSDGRIEKAEIALLEKVFSYLGLSQSEVYPKVLAAQGQSADGSQVGLARVKAEDRPFEYAIALEPEVVSSSDKIDLDMNRVSAMRAETNIVSKVLGEIFEDPSEVETELNENDEKVSDELAFGLDKKHTALLSELTRQSEWSITDFEALCQNFGVMSAGALETINEWSFDRYDDAILDEGNEILLNAELVEQFTGESGHGG